jgi:hypothetical protein
MFAGAPVIIYGESLGGAVAIYAAVNSKHKQSLGSFQFFGHVSTNHPCSNWDIQVVLCFKTPSPPSPTW